jgi:hypothetical protein
MGVWSFWARSGQGGHVLEATNKSWLHAQKMKGRKKKKFKKNGPARQVEASTYGQWATAGWRLDLLGWTHFFEYFYFLNFFLEVWEMGQGFRENGCTTPPFFGSVKSSVPHGDWRFHFFQIFFLLNLEYTWTFISTVGIFCSWKIEITKISSRFASVMEIFCTLLQCRVHLSMFHSSSTSNYWHTST